LKPEIIFKTYDLNFDDAAFADICASEMLNLLKKGAER
jgi:hypothetical protein